MLNLFRRHGRHCGPKADTTPENPNPTGEYYGKRSTSIEYDKGKYRSANWCPSKPQCFCFFEGTDGKGTHHKPQNVIDPRTGQKVRDWARASQIIRDLETPKPVEPDQKRTTPIEEAIGAYRDKKSKRSDAVRGKTKRCLERMQRFLWDKYRITTIEEVKLPHLTSFVAGWTDAHSTQRNNQTILRSFWTFCIDAYDLVKTP